MNLQSKQVLLTRVIAPADPVPTDTGLASHLDAIDKHGQLKEEAARRCRRAGGDGRHKSSGGMVDSIESRPKRRTAVRS